MNLLRRNADLVLFALLFVSLASLSWRRWASFQGDLSREWTTPARVAGGERLYRDVAFYYGPLAPWLEGAAMRAFGARVGTVLAFDLLTASGTLLLILLAGRAFLPLAARCALASVAVGVFAFAPDNGALVACYSQSALIAVALSWLAFLLALRGRSLGSGVGAGLALLGKLESGPALLGAFVVARSRARLAIVAALLAAAGYALALHGLTEDELVTYGPLRHLALPPEFRELYLRISGLHPALIARGALGASVGAALLLGWLLALPGVLALAERARAGEEAPWPEGSAGRAAGGAALLAIGLGLLPALAGEPIVTTLARGVPLLLVVALAIALWRARGASEPGERERARLAAAAALVGLGFVWRTFLWTVPSLPYAPLAALSALPAVCFLFSLAPARTRWLVVLPLLAAPLFSLPRLIVFYRSPRTCVDAPRGLWCPPGDEGELFSKLVAHLSRAGVKDRSLVVVPEASALGFLLGVESPLRLEQLLPGLLDENADGDAVRRFEEVRPERVVLVERPAAELGGGVFGRDYGRTLAALIARDYRPEARFSEGALTAVVLLRVTAPAPGARTRS